MEDIKLLPMAARTDIQALQGRVEKMERELRQIKAELRRARRTRPAPDEIPDCWNKAYNLYRQATDHLPKNNRPGYQQIHADLMEQARRNPSDKRYRHLPRRWQTFANYVSAYMRATGKPKHRRSPSWPRRA
jgi:hypothetical protein